MHKVLSCLALSVALSSCGDSSSSNSEASTDDVVNTSTNSDEIAGEMSAIENSDEQEITVGNSVDSSMQVSQFGSVFISGDEFVEFDAGFFRFLQPLEISIVLSEFNPTLDSCEVNRLELASERPNIEESFTNSVVEPISAGDVLTISSPAGSYAELLRNDQFGISFYALEEEDTLPAPAPSNLSISIPGDEFAAFSNVSIPTIVELQVNSPSAFEMVTPTTSYSWVASPIVDSFIEIDAFAVSADFSQTISVFCTVRDDGEFTIPSNIQSQMGSSFSGFGSISRSVVNVVQSGSAVLAIVSSSDN